MLFFPSQLLLLWRLRLLLLTIPFALINGFLYYLNPSLFLLLTALWCSAVVLLYAVYLPMLYKKSKYLVTEQEVHLQSGVFFSYQKKILISNIQYIILIQTPLQHLLHIASLRIMSAGGSLRLSGLPLQTAQHLLNQLSHEMEMKKR